MGHGTLVAGILAFILLGSVVSAGCGEVAPSNMPVTFSQLFSNPDQYNGKLITIEGFYFHGFETIVLCEKLENSGYTAGHLVPKGQMIWIEGGIPIEIYNQLPVQQMMGPSERYGTISVKGKFEYGGQYGHLGGFNAQIIPEEVKLLSTEVDNAIKQ